MRVALMAWDLSDQQLRGNKGVKGSALSERVSAFADRMLREAQLATETMAQEERGRERAAELRELAKGRRRELLRNRVATAKVVASQGAEKAALRETLDFLDPLLGEWRKQAEASSKRHAKRAWRSSQAEKAERKVAALKESLARLRGGCHMFRMPNSPFTLAPRQCLVWLDTERVETLVLPASGKAAGRGDESRGAESSCGSSQKGADEEQANEKITGGEEELTNMEETTGAKAPQAEEVRSAETRTRPLNEGFLNSPPKRQPQHAAQREVDQ